MPFSTYIWKNAEVVLKEDDLKKIFNKHDRNGDGRLSKTELKEAFKDLGSSLPGFRAHRGLHRADDNKDGFIDQKELENLLKYAGTLGYTVK